MGFEGGNSPAKALLCSSSTDIPAARLAIISSGSTYEPIGLAAKAGDVRMDSLDFSQSPMSQIILPRSIRSDRKATRVPEGSGVAFFTTASGGETAWRSPPAL
jgi:hypothetical protein